MLLLCSARAALQRAPRSGRFRFIPDAQHRSRDQYLRKCSLVLVNHGGQQTVILLCRTALI